MTRTKQIEWAVTPGLVPYPAAVAFMEDRVARIHADNANELVWLIEHPPLYTAGTSAQQEDLLQPDRLPVFSTSRGGQFTYHGPGQRIVYVMLDVAARGRDVRQFVCDLEQWLINALSKFNVTGDRRAGRRGIWIGNVSEQEGDAKIAAVGIRLRRWISFHGISLNVDPDLTAFEGIVPCGIEDARVTSLKALGIDADMKAVDQALRAEFEEIFGKTRDTGQLSLETEMEEKPAI